MRQTAEGATVPLPRFAPIPGGGGGLQDGATGEARSALEVGGCGYALYIISALYLPYCLLRRTHPMTTTASNPLHQRLPCEARLSSECSPICRLQGTREVLWQAQALDSELLRRRHEQDVEALRRERDAKVRRPGLSREGGAEDSGAHGVMLYSYR